MDVTSERSSYDIINMRVGVCLNVLCVFIIMRIVICLNALRMILIKLEVVYV